MVKFHLFVVIILFSFECFALEVSGTVTDRSGAPVSNASVKFVDANDPSVSFFANTNSSGRYVIDGITFSETAPAQNMLLFCYPNPFNRQTVISFHLDTRQRIELSVYNIVGQKVRVISSGDFEQGHHQIVWDGLSHWGAPVTPGWYICSLQTRTNRSAVKMLVTGGENIATPVWSSAEDQVGPKDLTETSQIYNVSISGDGFKEHHVGGVDMTGVSVKDFVIDRDVWTPFSTTGDYLGIYNGVDYTPFFIKGINLGSAIPGAWPGQLAISNEQYARWFRMMADAGFNAIRIYTLHYPHFYKELARYNMENPDKPLYLLHGVWLDEDYPDLYIPDLHTLTLDFDQDIHEAVDCLHGNKTLAPRPGYASGNYTADVSPWLLGWIIGREVHAIEITETNYWNPNNTSYQGAHLSITDASPSETWVTERLDRLVAYERTNYNTNRPVSFSSWPTLDPLTHPSEPWWGFEDAEELNLNKVKLSNAPGGLFISYHAYPYYPNFISKDEKYQNTSDEIGKNPYLAYLRELKEHYDYPIMIAEFGVPTSWGNARYSPSEMNHGGMTEEEQGKYTMRMFHNIYDTRYSGAVMFSWMDEWFKTTWITHPLTSGRRKLWHNIVSPENNYGLLNFVPNPAYYNSKKNQNFDFDRISQTSVWHDFTFFYVEAILKSPLSNNDTLWIALDTYKRNMGESTLPNGKKVLNNRAEFLLRVTADSARLFVTEAYNMQGIIHMNCYSPAFQTKATDGAPWIPYKWQNDETYEQPNTQDIGKFNVYKGNGKLDAHHAVQIRTDGILIRIPWTLLHFSDPSTSMVIDDNTSPSYCLQHWGCNMQYLNSIRSNEGVAVTMVYKNEVAEQSPYTWNDWDVNRDGILNPYMYIEVEKASLPIIREGLTNTPFIPK